MATTLEGGHSDSVLCVTVSEDGKVISGGENRELAIWTLDGTAPQKHKVAVQDDANDVTCLVCSKQKPYELYASCGQHVVVYDMREMSSPVTVFDFNDEEIDQIVLNEKEAFLAACDDSGHVKVISLQERRVYKTLRKHGNICSSVCFRPRRPWDLFSAGFDCMLMQWDFSRARPLCKVNLHELNAGTDHPESYMINPPFIHSMALSPNGGLLACGAENSLVYMFNAAKRTPEYLGPLNGHTHGVSQVHFPTFKEALLVSAGNDGNIALWDLTDLQGQRPGIINGVASVNGHGANGHVGNGHVGNGDNADDLENGAGAGLATGLECYSPQWTIDHEDKVNWVTSGVAPQEKVIVVADNSSALSVYTFPE